MKIINIIKDNAKNINKKRLKIKLFSIFSLLIIIMNFIVPLYNYENNNVYYNENIVYADKLKKDTDGSIFNSNLSDEEIEKIYSLYVTDVLDPWSWISDMHTYIIHQKNYEKVEGTKDKYDFTKLENEVYWWNAPNIQSTAYNTLYDFITNSGYGYKIGVPWEDREWIIAAKNARTASNAMEKYGFNLPNPAYIGERPLIAVSVTEILKPDSVLDGIGRLVSAVTSLFDGIKIIGKPTGKDMKTLLYLAPHDYENGGNSFKAWVKKNWKQAIQSKDNGGIDPGVVLADDGDDSTGQSPDGNYYVWGNLLEYDNEKLKEKGLSADEICQILNDICGEKYGEVASNIVKAGLDAGINNVNIPVRQMTYDYSKLNAKDKQIVGITDPRAEMQKSLIDTGEDKQLKNYIANFIINISGKISELSVALNGITNFTFIENAGIDPTVLWTNSILKFIMTIAGCAFIIYIIYASVKVIKNPNNSIYTVVRVFSTAIILCTILGICYNTENFYNFLKDTSTKIFNLSNVTLESNANINELYGTSKGADAENVTLWIPYFNLWTTYHTNHTILDDSQQINEDDDYGETKKLNISIIGGKRQKLWSILLADIVSSDKVYSNSIYRIVDHFMAPRINPKFDFDYFTENDVDAKTYVEQNGYMMLKNENYNGNIQSTINISSIPFQLIILFITLLKVFVFFEFIYNIAMLLINLALSIVEKDKIKNIIKDLIGSMLDLVFLNLYNSILVWLCLICEGIIGVILSLFSIYVTYAILKTVYNSNSMFTPKFIKPLRKCINSLSNIFRENTISESEAEKRDEQGRKIKQTKESKDEQNGGDE